MQGHAEGKKGRAAGHTVTSLPPSFNWLSQLSCSCREQCGCVMKMLKYWSPYATRWAAADTSWWWCVATDEQHRLAGVLAPMSVANREQETPGIGCTYCPGAMGMRMQPCLFVASTQHTFMHGVTQQHAVMHLQCHMGYCTSG